MRKSAYPVRRWNSKRARPSRRWNRKRDRPTRRRHRRPALAPVRTRLIHVCLWEQFRKQRSVLVKRTIEDLLLCFDSYGEVQRGLRAELRRQIRQIVEGAMP